MSKSSCKVIKKTKQSESFAAKADILNIDIDRQVDMLNELYKGKVTFINSTGGIRVSRLARGILSVELPENDNYDIERLFDYVVDDRFFGLVVSTGYDLESVKLPKSIKKVKISRMNWWMNKVKRIFVYDTTEIEFDDTYTVGGRLELIGILSTKGGKNKVIRM